MVGLLIFRGKKAKFRGIFRGKFAEKSADFAGFSREKVKIREKISRFRGVFAGEKSKFTEKSADFEGFCRKKSKFEAFSGANAQKNRPLSREISGETSTSPRNNQ